MRFWCVVINDIIYGPFNSVKLANDWINRMGLDKAIVKPVADPNQGR